MEKGRGYGLLRGNIYSINGICAWLKPNTTSGAPCDAKYEVKHQSFVPFWNVVLCQGNDMQIIVLFPSGKYQRGWVRSDVRSVPAVEEPDRGNAATAGSSKYWKAHILKCHIVANIEISNVTISAPFWSAPGILVPASAPAEVHSHREATSTAKHWTRRWKKDDDAQ